MLSPHPAREGCPRQLLLQPPVRLMGLVGIENHGPGSLGGNPSISPTAGIHTYRSPSVPVAHLEAETRTIFRTCLEIRRIKPSAPLPDASYQTKMSTSHLCAFPIYNPGSDLAKGFESVYIKACL